jgi:hypothetical protein
VSRAVVALCLTPTRYPKSFLGTLLQHLKIVISDAELRIDPMLLQCCQGDFSEISGHLTRHYVSQLKQWSFTLITSASPFQNVKVSLAPQRRSTAPTHAPASH